MTDLNRRQAFLGLAGLALITLVAAMGSAPELQQIQVIVSGEPATLCIPPSDPAIEDLRAGNRRAVLVVHAREGGGSLRVSLPAAEAETRIGFFPDGDFSVASGDEARRYFLPSAEGAEAGDICFDVRLEGTPGGRVEVSLEVSEPPGQ